MLDDTHTAADVQQRAARYALFLDRFDHDLRPRGLDEPSVGLDFEYRLSPAMGLGGFVDYAGGDLDSTVLGVAWTLIFNLTLLPALISAIPLRARVSRGGSVAATRVLVGIAWNEMPQIQLTAPDGTARVALVVRPEGMGMVVLADEQRSKTITPTDT